jgi:hypothetical protein
MGGCSEQEERKRCGFTGPGSLVGSADTRSATERGMGIHLPESEKAKPRREHWSKDLLKSFRCTHGSA